MLAYVYAWFRFFCVFCTFSPGCLESDHSIRDYCGCQYQQAMIYIERLVSGLRDIPRSTLYYIARLTSFFTYKIL